MESKKYMELKSFVRKKLPDVRYTEVLISNIFLSMKEEIGADKAVLIKIARDMNRLIDFNILKNLEMILNEFSIEERRELVLDILSGKFEVLTKYDYSSDSMCELAIKLLNIDGSGHMVRDFGSGYGNFLAQVYKYTLDNDFILKDLLGVELDSNSAYASLMALYCLKDNEVEPDIIIGDIIRDDLNLVCTRGYVFPPFGLKMINKDEKIISKVCDYVFTSRNSVEWIFVDRMIANSMKGIAFVPMKLLYNSADIEYRNKLIENGLLEGIIELPGGTITFSSAKVCALLFSKDNTKVKILDESNILGKAPSRFNQVKLPVDDIISDYNAKDIMMLDGEELMQLTNISPSSILVLKEKESREIDIEKIGVRLADYAEIFVGSQYTSKNFESMFTNEKSGYRILTSSDINDGKVEWDKLQSIDYKDTKFDKYAVRKNDIVITSKSSKFKTVVVDIEPSDKILVTGGMIIVRPYVDKLNSTYLKIFLDSPNGERTIKAIQKGATIVTINVKDLSEIKVPMIDIVKQEKMALEYNQKLEQINMYKKEIEKISNELKEFFVESFY